MCVVAIARKNLKLFVRSYILIPVLIGMPLFQMYLLTVVLSNDSNAGTSYKAIDLVFLESGATPDAAQFFAASMLVMFILITGMLGGASLIEEREERSLLRILAAPLSKNQVIFGSLLSYALITLVYAFVIMSLSFLLLGVDWGTVWIKLFVVTLCLVYVAISLALLLVAMFRDSKTASGVMSLIVVVMAFLSDGLTGGSVTNSGQFGRVSYLTINKWGYEAYLHAMLDRPWADLWLNILVLMASGLVLSGLAALLLRGESVYE